MGRKLLDYVQVKSDWLVENAMSSRYISPTVAVVVMEKALTVVCERPKQEVFVQSKEIRGDGIQRDGMSNAGVRRGRYQHRNLCPCTSRNLLCNKLC